MEGIKKKYKEKINGLEYHVLLNYNHKKSEYDTFYVTFYPSMGGLSYMSTKKDLSHFNKVVRFVCDSIKDYAVKEKISYIKFNYVNNDFISMKNNFIIKDFFIRHISRTYGSECVIDYGGYEKRPIFINLHKAFPDKIEEPENYKKISTMISCFKKDHGTPIKPKLSHEGYNINFDIGKVNMKIIFNDLTGFYLSEALKKGDGFGQNFRFRSFESLFKFVERCLIKNDVLK